MRWLKLHWRKKPVADTTPRKMKFTDIDLENESLSTLLEFQAKLSRLILDKNKQQG